TAQPLILPILKTAGPVRIVSEGIYSNRERNQMTQHEIAVAKILIAVINGKTTLAQLRRKLADGLVIVNQLGEKNCERSLLDELAAIEAAITRIEAERVKYDRLKNN